MVLPLDGMKVVELGYWVLGPTCARVLGELGADVIKVENPDGGDPGRGVAPPKSVNEANLEGNNPMWQWWNLGKRDIVIDLGQDNGRKIIYKLLETADIFVTNLRPTIVDRFLLDYESVNGINPRIIYAQATGFGFKGSHRDRRAFDETAFWTRSGIMSILGEPDVPPVPLRGAMGDLTTSIFLVSAILSAIIARDRFGFGQKVDISLMSSGMWVAGGDVQRYLTWGEDYNYHKFPRKNMTNPLRNAYQTKDGKWLFFMMLQTDRFWSDLCQALEREDLDKDPRFDSHAKRIDNSELIISILDEVLATRTMAEWAERFDRYGLIWEPETTVPEVLNDPQVSENGLVTELEHPSGRRVKLLDVPFQLSQTPARARALAPELGQHTEEVLLELGYDWSEIAKLKEEKVIL